VTQTGHRHVETASRLEFAPVPRKLTALIVAIVLLMPVAALGCGGGGGDDGDNGSDNVKNGLSTTDNLKLAQDRADIDGFCQAAGLPHGSDLYDRGFFTVIDAVNRLIVFYKKDPDKVYRDYFKKQNLTVKQITEDAEKKLKGCGKDGKTLAKKLTQVLSSS
jgi:hypothetical protein